MTSEVKDYKLDDQVGFVLRRVSQRHAQIFLDLAPEGLTATQFSTLVRLGEVGPCSQNHLGRLTAMDVATIKGVVARLFARGFVRLDPDPGDRRRTIISLTDTGQNLLDDLHRAGHRITEATLDPLGPEERSSLLATLRKLV